MLSLVLSLAAWAGMRRLTEAQRRDGEVDQRIRCNGLAGPGNLVVSPQRIFPPLPPLLE